MRVLKRSGEVVEYQGDKVILAVMKAMIECDIAEDIAYEVAEDIEEEITGLFDEDGEPVDIEEIQDTIEQEMANKGYFKVAKEFVIYRNKRAEARNKKWEMTDLQYDIWHQKYEWNNEGFEGWLNRVSGGNENIKKLIRQKKFLFGGRILANRGLNQEGRKITYSNCYVLTPPKDNIESIFETAGKLARTFSYGGGVGIDIGNLRPRDAKVNNAALTTSGACSFMDLYSLTTELIGQLGRRGALMISIPCSHPDIEEFIDIKTNLDRVTKANISIRVDDEFMQAVVNKTSYKLRFTVESTGEEIIKEVDADKLFTKLAKNNWDVAEPGLLGWSRIEDWHLLSEDKEFKYAGVNPCAEEPLPENGSCLLGSINLAEFVNHSFTNNAEFDFVKFDEAVKYSVIALNEVLDEGLPLHPLAEQRQTVGDYRQIGLGIMGMAELFVKLGVRYGSEESLKVSEKIAHAMINSALQASSNLAKEYGAYPRYKQDAILSSPFLVSNATEETIELIKKYGIRNSQLLTCAPTGSISTMIGVSGGIEPHFRISYIRKTETLNDGDTFYKVFTPIAKEYMEVNNLSDESQLPDIFITADKLNYEERLRMQSVWQKYIDASISSTVNVPQSFTIEDAKQLYIKAWQYGLKGVTLYREGCRRGGILSNHKTDKSIGDMSIEELQDLIYQKAQDELTNDPNRCPICKGKMNMTGGCSECEQCGYSPCAI